MNKIEDCGQRKCRSCSGGVLSIVSTFLLWFVMSFSASDLLAQTDIDWPEIELTKQASGLNQPAHITHAGDGSGRLFAIEQPGRIRIIKNGILLSTPFLDIADSVKCCDEQGLLSVAFPPDYPSKGYFYINYTRKPDGDTIVSRYFVTENPDVADPDSEEIILAIDQPFPNHNGGLLVFGPDGFLYIGMGDGGSGGDPFDNAQNPGSLLGKMLRIDVESGIAPYIIPSSNPFTQTTGFRGEIWALGYRNPWRFSFDRDTDDLYIADVGQDLFEEVDFQPASSTGGENYGWNIMEGGHCFKSNTCDQTGLVLPVAEYDHSQGCSITGGFVYRGLIFPRMQGVYFYADFCSGNIWGLKREGTTWQNTLLASTPFNIASFGEDEEGNLYLTDYSNGDIFLIVDTSTPWSNTNTYHNDTAEKCCWAEWVCDRRTYSHCNSVG
ncbi:MAG: PQQ-dependent sugar dehydrogenase [Thermodesulfobacteriota bacterium]